MSEQKNAVEVKTVKIAEGVAESRNLSHYIIQILCFLTYKFYIPT